MSRAKSSVLGLPFTLSETRMILAADLLDSLHSNGTSWLAVLSAGYTRIPCMREVKKILSGVFRACHALTDDLDSPPHPQ